MWYPLEEMGKLMKNKNYLIYYEWYCPIIERANRLTESFFRDWFGEEIWTPYQFYVKIRSSCWNRGHNLNCVRWCKL